MTSKTPTKRDSLRVKFQGEYNRGWYDATRLQSLQEHAYDDGYEDGRKSMYGILTLEIVIVGLTLFVAAMRDVGWW